MVPKKFEPLKFYFIWKHPDVQADLIISYLHILYSRFHQFIILGTKSKLTHWLQNLMQQPASLQLLVEYVPINQHAIYFTATGQPTARATICCFHSKAHI